ncbi:MAG TPA: NAD(P)-dependent oxidoreductase, partial [Longimicrobiales bacterium]|nr:NAD(P)-dependent oxidoreductase [Longimicrobiales bacterium]
MKVLVTHVVAMYLETTDIPADISITTFTQLPAGDYAGLIASVNTPVRGDAIAQLPNLKIIANYGVGYDNIDVAFAKARGIAVTNTPGVLTEATAELTWALILAVARRIGEGERLVRAGNWKGWKPDFLPGTGLSGKTLAIVGAGRIGTAVGEKASAFGMNVRYWRRGDDLDELLKTADVISIHLSKSPETEKLIDARRLSLLKDDAMFINTARGALVDESALIKELQS